MGLVLKNLTRRRLRSFFCVLGVAVGIGAVVGLVSLARGVRKELDDLMVRLRGDVIVKQKDCVSPETSRVREDLVAEIAGIDGVAGVSGYTFQLFFFDAFRVPVYGFDPEQPILRKVDVVEGRALAAEGLREVMVGAEAARHLGLRAGQKIAVPPSDPGAPQLEVVGIYSTGARYQDVGCIVHLRTAQLVGRMAGQVTMCAVDVADAAAAAPVRDRLRQRYPELDVQLAHEFAENLEDYRLVTKFAWAVSAMAAIVGAIGVLNTMLMSVSERTREIGMLLALGWSRMKVMRMVLAEGVVVSALGGALGIGFGVLLVGAVSRWLQELPITSGHDAALFAQALALAVGLGVVGSLLPASRAARLSPVEALRHE